MFSLLIMSSRLINRHKQRKDETILTKLEISENGFSFSVIFLKKKRRKENVKQKDEKRMFLIWYIKSA